MVDWKVIREWIFILIVLAIGLYLIIYLRGEQKQCVINPTTFSITKLEAQNQATIVCSCLASRNDSSARFQWTRQGIKTEITDPLLKLNQ